MSGSISTPLAVNSANISVRKGRFLKFRDRLSLKFVLIFLDDKLPGVGLIRAATIFAYLDTHWRFKKRSRLHKYCGVGLVRSSSGKDKNGKPKPARLKLPWAVNGRLKNAVLGAAMSATQQKDNGFRDYYERMLSNGITPANARHSVARKMVSVVSAMWKTDSAFDPKLL